MNAASRTFVVFVALALVGAGFLLVFSASRAITGYAVVRGPEKARLGLMVASVDLAQLVAEEKGFFAKRGVDVEFVKFESSNAGLDALLAGSIDVGLSTGLGNAIPASETAGGQFKLFALSMDTRDNFVSFILVQKNSTIRSIEELRGKRILTRTGSSPSKLLKQILRGAGIKTSEVEIVQVGQSLMLPAFAAGQADAVLVNEPDAAIALEKDIARVLVENPRVKYVLDPYPLSAVPLSTKFLKERPETAGKIIEATDEAIDFIRANETEAKRIIARSSGLDESVAFKIRLPHLVKSNELNASAPVVQALADLLWRDGETKGRVDAVQLFLTG